MSKRSKSVKQVASGQSDDTIVKDTSPYIPQDKKLREPLNIRQRHVLNAKQNAFIETALRKDTNVVLCEGLWGTSKTWCAVYCALQLLSQQKVDSIAYLRSPVEAGKGLGFVPGTIEEKINPYAEPLFEKLHEFLDAPAIKMLEKENRIQVIPPGFIRGRSWSCKAIIVDEAASFPRDMLELILSRVGPRCKVFVIGSRHQSDTGDANGFMEVFRAFNDAESKEHGIHTFEFNDEADIVRSVLLRFIMRKLGVLPAKVAADEPMFPPHSAMRLSEP